MLANIFSQISRFVPARWKWILEHAGFKRYFVNTGWMFFGQMFSLVISFFIGAWLARYLGPENYGIISYAVAFVGLFTFIAYLGIHNILLRDLVKKPENKDELMGTGFGLLLAGSIVAFVLIVIFVFIFEPSNFIRGLIILYASTFLWSAFGIISVFFQSTVEAKKNVQATVISALVASILKVILISTGQGIIWLMIIFVLESLILLALYICNYLRSGYRFTTWKFNSGLAKQILSGAWLLALAAAAGYIFLRVDQVMIRHFLDETAVGLYSAAIKLVEIWYFIPGIICGSLLPAIINAKKVSQEKFLSRLRKLYILLGGIALVIALLLSVFAPIIMNFLFGSAYFESIGILRIYVWSGVGFFLNAGFYQYFLTENRLKTIFYFYLFLMVLNITLNFILISNFGITGAAWATMISYSVGALAILIGNKKLLLKNNKSIISNYDN